MEIIDVFKNFPSPKNNEQYKGLILLGGFVVFVIGWSKWSCPEESRQEDTAE